MSIGKNIALKRKEFGWTQKQLAEKLNVSDKTISSWENERTYPDIGSLIQLSDTLALSLDELIKEDMDMVKTMDQNLHEGRRWKKWRILCIGISVVVIAFVVLNIAWLFWTNQRQAELDNYPWSEEELPAELDVFMPGYYVKKNDLYVHLIIYKTKYSTPYLHFDHSTRQVSVREGATSSLWIKSKDNILFFNGKGSNLQLNEKLEPVKGKVKGEEKMTSSEELAFLEKYRDTILKYYEAGITVFDDLN